MKEKLFFLIIIVFSAQLLLGQEKFTIRGEFPDNTLDGKYVLLIDKSSLLEEREGQKQERHAVVGCAEERSMIAGDM